MSWSELERLVADAERLAGVRRVLSGCRDDADLLLRARRLGYRITRFDLHRAWLEDQRERASVNPIEARKSQRASC
jgi:hypothetical protein